MNISCNTYIACDGNEVADLACKFCSKLPLRHNIEGREVGLPLSDHHKIFHSECHNCFGNSSIKLCESCSHVRFEHYMGCFRQDNTVSQSMKLRLKSLGSFDPGCLACSFWRDLLEKRPRKFVQLHDNVKITLRSIDRDGGQKSLLRWPLILGPNPVAEEWTPWLLIAQDNKRSENIQVGVRIRPPDRDKILPLNPMIDWASVSQFPLGIQTTGEEALKSIRQIQKFWKEPWLANYGSLPENLGVIDVFQDCVVPIPRSCPYVTLSYVWGKDHGQLQATMANKAILAQPNSLSTVTLPQTISDAMEVCRKLKQRYLWVDRLCIPQDDPDIKVLLDCMGAIYQNASFGIVAVDGDAETGLPGVGKTRRKWVQSSLALGRLELLACAPNLRFYIPETAWASRGWTFQEQAMSNQQLYFTHYGLYYDAASIPGEFSESPAEMSGMRRRNYDLREDYWDALEKYSLRVLTYPGDFLHAFSGLLFSITGAETL